MRKRLFTSESVSPGHPDKIADQISDAVLDACLEQDSMSRVACEVFTTTNTVVVGGEITTSAKIDVEKIVRDTLIGIGYTNDDYGIDGNICNVINLLGQQSQDIAQGVNCASDNHETGAGDQGIIFGFATDETPGYMPLAITIAHKLVRVATEKRQNGEFKFARPDMKSQVTIDYSDLNNIKVDTVLMSIQHDPDFNEAAFKKYVKEQIMETVVESFGLNTDFKVLINPTGRFVVGGPHGDAGLTGRKIIVDTYGGYARHGGGAFSGKDSTKVDRSAAYMARYIAKNLVAAGYAKQLEIQLSYAIGVAKPVSVFVETFNTSAVSNDFILEVIEKHFNMTPDGIVNTLKLRQPVFKKTATFGHFGRNNHFSWEHLDKVDDLKAELENYNR